MLNLNLCKHLYIEYFLQQQALNICLSLYISKQNTKKEKHTQIMKQ